MKSTYSRSQLLGAAAPVLSLFAFLFDAAPAVTRGPYLQLVTPTSIVVRWRTDVATDSRVAYGANLRVPSIARDPAPTTEHRVVLTGLAPATRYYYSIGSSAAPPLRPADSANTFVTAPVPGQARPIRVWVLGDSGTAGPDARHVRDAYAAYTGARRTDLWLMLGDNAYNDGLDRQYQAAVFDTYARMLRQTVLWPSLGNHDGHTSDSAAQSGPYFDAFTLPARGEAGGAPSRTEAYYSFNYGNVHFVCLDSYGSGHGPSGPMLTWLKADLAAAKEDWAIAFFHHPPYSRGSHDSDTERIMIEMREKVLPILESYGVDLVLSGHSHSYERSCLLDGHYGPSSTLQDSMKKNGGDGRLDGSGAYSKPAGLTPHSGTVYVVAGSSAKTSPGPLNHPAMIVSQRTLGSMVLDVSGNRLDAVFLDARGNSADHFTIRKDDGDSSVKRRPLPGQGPAGPGGSR